MFGSRGERILKCWIFLYNAITLTDSTGILLIRFDRFQAVYTGQNSADQNAGVSSTTVSMATSQPLETLSSSFTTTPITPVTPSWEDPPACQPPARYRILLCMDMIGQPERCRLGREETDMVQITQGTVTPSGESSDIVIFGNNLRGMPNPLVNPLRYNFPAWPGSISVTAYVQCCGVPETRRCEEKLSGRMTVSPSENQRTAVPTIVNLTNKGSLSLAVTIFCSPNYYGVNCSTFCRDDNQADNRVCHPTTGQLVCSPGWGGTNCNEDINECDLGVCRHGGGCNNLLGTFTCHCLRGSSGRFCENRAASCPSKPCLNGGTCFEDLASVGFQCECPPDWTGAQCASPVPRTTLGPPTTATAASDQDGPKTEPQTSSDWTLWYVVIALLAVTCVVVIILIICVIWSSRRRRYQISSMTKPDNAISTVATVTTGPSPGQFDNMVYLHDPEDIDLQPSSSNLYQRALMSDDPYVNQAALYEDRIDPDRPFEGEGQDDPRGGVRPGSLALDNFYASWDCIRQPEDSQYESITFQGFQERLDSLQCTQSDTSSTYRRSSDPASDSHLYQTHLTMCPNDLQSDTSEMVASEPNYGRRLSTFKPATESQNFGQLAEPVYDHRFPNVSANENLAQYDYRFPNVSQTVQSESGMSKNSIKETSLPRSSPYSETNTKVTDRRMSSLANSKVTSSFKRPCPTPRTNKEACPRKNNDVPSNQQQNASQNSGTPSALQHTNSNNSGTPSAPQQSTSQNNELPASQVESNSQNTGIPTSHPECNGIPSTLQQGSQKISGVPSSPKQSSRKNSSIPSSPQQNNRKKSGLISTPQGKRKNSVDLLNQTIGLLQDAPAENSRSKSGSYDLSK